MADKKQFSNTKSIVKVETGIVTTFYNSRVIGLIMTAVINKFAKLGHIKLGKKIHIHVVSIGCVGNLGLH
jgi:hypothetical protein